jgi:hypothetical protein
MNAHNILSGAALVIIGLLALLLVFFEVPQPNKDLIIYALGALSGALTVGGVKLADKVVNSRSHEATIQPDAETKP